MGPRLRGDDVSAGISRLYRLHYPGEAVSRVRSHISPGPYRSFRELSLARSVDLATWCPPTFVGNSGIECSNGHRGFALLFFGFRHTPRRRGIQYAAASRFYLECPGILDRPPSRAMT